MPRKYNPESLLRSKRPNKLVPSVHLKRIKSPKPKIRHSFSKALRRVS